MSYQFIKCVLCNETFGEDEIIPVLKGKDYIALCEECAKNKKEE